MGLLSTFGNKIDTFATNQRKAAQAKGYNSIYDIDLGLSEFVNKLGGGSGKTANTGSVTSVPQLATSFYNGFGKSNAQEPNSNTVTPPPLPGNLTGTPTNLSGGGGANTPQFQKTQLNGTVYNNINDYNAAALKQFQDNQAKQGEFNDRANKFSGSFGGQFFENVTDYANAVRNAATSEYNKLKGNIEKAYQSGLIDFDEREAQIKNARDNVKLQTEQLTKGYNQSKEGIGEARDAGYKSQASFFSNVSPDAYQSQQQTMFDKTTSEADKQFGNLEDQKRANDAQIASTTLGLDQAEAQTGRARSQFTDTYNQNLEAANKGLTQQTDAANDYETTYKNNQSLTDDQRKYNADQSLQAYRDTLANNVLSLQAQQDAARKAGAVSAAANVQQYDPVSFLQGLRNYTIGALGQGYNEAQAKQLTEQYGAQSGIGKEQLSQFINFLYPNGKYKPADAAIYGQ